MARNPSLQILIDAKDKATESLNRVAGRMDAIDKKSAQAKVDAKDNASDELNDIRDKLNRLDNDEAELLVKAETKAARADLRVAQRELLNLDNEEAEVEVKADIAAAKSRLDALDRELDAIDGRRVEAEIDVDDPEGSGNNAGALFGAGALKGFAAAGVATAIASAFNSGIEKIQLRNKMRQQFGLTSDDAEEFSAEAGELYQDGWGESLDEVVMAFGSVKQQMADVGSIAEDEISNITKAALAMSQIWDVDVNEVIRATSQLMENNLAGSATEAMDLIVTGLQDGSNAAGDLWETITEYSQHFEAMGLSGQDMFTMLADGMANGQRDTDKLLDAVKEFRLRGTDTAEAVSLAYEDLGLDADVLRDKIAQGGPAAREAFLEVVNAINSVKDPVKRNQLAVALIGTQYEDLGPKALDSLLAIEGATNDITGATQDLVDQTDATTSDIEVLWRQTTAFLGRTGEDGAEMLLPLVGVLSSIAEGIEEIETTAQDSAGTGDFFGLFKTIATGGLNDFYDYFKATLNSVEEDTDEFTGSVTSSAEAIRAVLDGTADSGEVSAGVLDSAYQDIIDITSATADEQDDLADATSEAAMAAQESRDAHAEEAAAIQTAKEAAEEKADAHRRAADAGYDLIETTWEVSDAQIANKEAIEEADKALEDATEGSEEHTAAARARGQALIDTVRDSQSLADATENLAREEAAQRGTALSSAQATRINNQSLLEQARTLEGPQRDALLNHIQRVNNIDEDVMTDIRAAIRAGDLPRAQSLINGVTNRNYNAHISVSANTWAAENALNWAARNRTSNISSRKIGGHWARGTPYAPGGMSVVGEEGPEILNLPMGASVTDAQLSKGKMARMGDQGGGGSSPTIVNNITQNFPVGTRPADVAHSTRKYSRIQGPL